MRRNFDRNNFFWLIFQSLFKYRKEVLSKWNVGERERSDRMVVFRRYEWMGERRGIMSGRYQTMSIIVPWEIQQIQSASFQEQFSEHIRF